MLQVATCQCWWCSGKGRAAKESEHASAEKSPQISETQKENKQKNITSTFTLHLVFFWVTLFFVIFFKLPEKKNEGKDAWRGSRASTISLFLNPSDPSTPFKVAEF